VTPKGTPVLPGGTHVGTGGPPALSGDTRGRAGEEKSTCRRLPALPGGVPDAPGGTPEGAGGTHVVKGGTQGRAGDTRARTGEEKCTRRDARAPSGEAPGEIRPSLRALRGHAWPRRKRLNDLLGVRLAHGRALGLRRRRRPRRVRRVRLRVLSHRSDRFGVRAGSESSSGTASCAYGICRRQKQAASTCGVPLLPVVAGH
jgi:hypothetical protein